MAANVYRALTAWKGPVLGSRELGDKKKDDSTLSRGSCLPSSVLLPELALVLADELSSLSAHASVGPQSCPPLKGHPHNTASTQHLPRAECWGRAWDSTIHLCTRNRSIAMSPYC